VYPKSKKVSYPYRASGEELLPLALGVLELAGGDDDDGTAAGDDRGGEA
jgi:transcription-repair coupling factor (superfamily II helicase)